MTCLVAGVAQGLIFALTGNVPRLFAVPANSLRGAFCCKVAWKVTVIARRRRWALLSEVPRSPAVLAYKIPVATPFSATVWAAAPAATATATAAGCTFTAQPISSARTAAPAPAATVAPTSAPAVAS